MSGECRFSRIERHRLIRHRVRIDDHRARSDTAGIDNAPDHQSRDRRPIWIFRDRNGYPVVIVGGSSPARVVALPAAAQTDVAVVALRRRDGDSAAPVRHVLPHQVTAFRQVDRFHKEKARNVLDFAVSVARRQLDIRDDRIVRIFGIKLTERAARQSFILAGLAECRSVESRRDFFIDDDLFHVSAGGLRAHQDQ